MARLALITGGTRGIGKGCAIALRDAGYRVVSNYGRDEEAAATFRSETGLPAARWNVADFEACAAGVAEVEAEHGPIDILVNNAGISPDRFMHKMPHETWRLVVTTNLDSVFNMCRSVVPSMRERKFGRIVNIASMAALKPTFGESAYSASKAGMIAFTKTVALENGRNGITANCIAPGYIDTDMIASAPQDWFEDRIERTPVHRVGEPSEVGRCAVFLADEDSGFITRSVLSVTGGYELA